MTMSIICTFIVCWMPYFVVHNVHIWSEYTYHIPASIYVIAETLALVNSTMNPILYAFFNLRLGGCGCKGSSSSSDSLWMCCGRGIEERDRPERWGGDRVIGRSRERSMTWKRKSSATETETSYKVKQFRCGDNC